MMLVNVIKWKVKVLRSPGEDLDDNDGECHKMKSESSLVTRWRAHAMYCPPNASCPECPFVLIIFCFRHCHHHYQHHHYCHQHRHQYHPSSSCPECQFVFLFCSLRSSHIPNICRNCPFQRMHVCRACHICSAPLKLIIVTATLNLARIVLLPPLGGIRGGPQLRGGPI